MTANAIGIQRLHSIILTAAHRACDLGKLNIAVRLLWLDEEIIAVEPDPRRRRLNVLELVAIHERLWHLRNFS